MYQKLDNTIVMIFKKCYNHFVNGGVYHEINHQYCK